MRCKRCGADVRSGLSVCPSCGFDLGEKRRLKIRCHACGSRVLSGPYLCPMCGQVLRANWLPEIALGVVLLLVVAAAVWVWRRSALAANGSSRTAYVAQQMPTTPATIVSATVISASSTPTPSLTAQPSATATPTPTMTWTPTLTKVPSTNTPIPTHTLLPSATPTLTAFPPTQAPTPTQTRPQPTATVQPTTRVPQPTSTPTPALAWPAPKLLSPANEQRFFGDPNAQIWLTWEPVGVLGKDEWYSVSVRYFANGVVNYTGSWEKDARWMLPGTLFMKYDPARPGFQWDVTVMKQTSTKPDGSREGVPTSQTSETRTFYWH